jgi:hypothetical protein
MSDKGSLVLYQKYYDLMIYSFPIVNRFPREYQVFLQGLQNFFRECYQPFTFMPKYICL